MFALESIFQIEASSAKFSQVFSTSLGEACSVQSKAHLKSSASHQNVAKKKLAHIARENLAKPNSQVNLIQKQLAHWQRVWESS